MEKRIAELEESVKAIAKHMKSEIKRLEQLNREVTGLDKSDVHLGKEIRELEKKIKQQQEEIARLKTLEKKVHRSLEKETTEDIEKVSSRFKELIERDIQKINQVNEKLRQLSQAIDKSEEKSLKEIKKLHEFINDHKLSINELRKETKLLKDDIQEHHNAMSELKSSLRKIIQKELKDNQNIKTISKFIEDFEKYVENDIKKTGALNSKIDLITKELSSLEEKLKTQKEIQAKKENSLSRELDTLRQDVDSLLKLKESFGQTIEEEDVERVSIEKEFQDMKHRQKEFEKKLDEFKKEIISQQKFVEDANKNLKLTAMKYLGDELNRFANTLDKKLPDLATKRDFDIFVQNVNRKIDSIEKPDVSYLEIKINELERKIAQIYDMIKNISDRIPVVVE